jgi:hypothetical protein
MTNNQLYDKINEFNEKLMFIINEVNKLKNEFNQTKYEFEKQKNKQEVSKEISNENIENTDNVEIKLINDDDLNSFFQYDEKTLGFNMERGTLSPYQVYRTQKNLSNEFIVEYILNENYATFMEDYDITINKIIGKFPNFAYFDPKTYRSKKSSK